MSDTTRRVDIFDHSTGEHIAEGIEVWDIASCLACAFHDDDTPREILEACAALEDAYAHDEPTEAYEAYFNVTITDC